MQRNGSTRRERAENARILAASDICGICGHPGADAVDHKDPISRGGQRYGAENKQPAHHDVACPTCGLRCNRIKADKPWAPIVKRSGALR